MNDEWLGAAHLLDRHAIHSHIHIFIYSGLRVFNHSFSFCSLLRSLTHILPPVFLCLTVGQFSSYKTTEASGYAAFIFFVFIWLAAVCIHKWREEDLNVKMIDVFEGGGKKFSNLALNAWDHTVYLEEEADDLKKMIANDFNGTILEEEIADKGRHRTAKQKYIIKAKRILGVFLYVE